MKMQGTNHNPNKEGQSGGLAHFKFITKLLSGKCGTGIRIDIQTNEIELTVQNNFLFIFIVRRLSTRVLRQFNGKRIVFLATGY